MPVGYQDAAKVETGGRIWKTSSSLCERGGVNSDEERVHSGRYLPRTSCPAGRIRSARQDVGTKQPIGYRPSSFPETLNAGWSRLLWIFLSVSWSQRLAIHSIVYEALSSGAKVGLLPVPRLRSRSRVLCGLEKLIDGGFIDRFADWEKSPQLAALPETLREANRCASSIRAGDMHRDPP